MNLSRIQTLAIFVEKVKHDGPGQKKRKGTPQEKGVFRGAPTTVMSERRWGHARVNDIIVIVIRQ
jgi:hypothetical protein